MIRDYHADDQMRRAAHQRAASIGCSVPASMGCSAPRERCLICEQYEKLVDAQGEEMNKAFAALVNTQPTTIEMLMRDDTVRLWRKSDPTKSIECKVAHVGLDASEAVPGAPKASYAQVVAPKESWATLNCLPPGFILNAAENPESRWCWEYVRRDIPRPLLKGERVTIPEFEIAPKKEVDHTVGDRAERARMYESVKARAERRAALVKEFMRAYAKPTTAETRAIGTQNFSMEAIVSPGAKPQVTVQALPLAAQGVVIHDSYVMTNVAPTATAADDMWKAMGESFSTMIQNDIDRAVVSRRLLAPVVLEDHAVAPLPRLATTPEPILKLTCSDASPAQQRQVDLEAMDRLRARVQRTQREWPYGKELQFTVNTSREMICWFVDTKGTASR